MRRYPRGIIYYPLCNFILYYRSAIIYVSSCKVIARYSLLYTYLYPVLAHIHRYIGQRSNSVSVIVDYV